MFMVVPQADFVCGVVSRREIIRGMRLHRKGRGLLGVVDAGARILLATKRENRQSSYNRSANAFTSQIPSLALKGGYKLA